MTGDEMESAIEFLLQGQAKFEARLVKTNEQMELTNQRVSLLAETQTEFIQTILPHVEAQREINASLRQMTNELRQERREQEQRVSDLVLAQQVTGQSVSGLVTAQQWTQ